MENSESIQITALIIVKRRGLYKGIGPTGIRLKGIEALSNHSQTHFAVKKTQYLLQNPPMATFVKTNHLDPYKTLDHALPAVSVSGKLVLVTG